MNSGLVQRLEPVLDADGVAVFKQATVEPMFVNPNHPNGSRWVCAHCADRTLVTDGVPGDFWGVAFRCGGCGLLSKPPAVGPGRIAPAQSVVAPIGEYLISSVQGRDVAIVEERLWQRQRAGNREVLGLRRSLTPGELRVWEYQTRGLLGGAAFTRLWEAHQRARGSATPPRKAHPLMEMIEELRRAERDLADGTDPSIDASLLLGLDATLHVARRWRRDPAFDTMRPGLVDPREFVHTIVTLTVASYLRDAGNASYLYDAPGRGRAADLRLDFSPRTFAVAEVKTPERLFRPPDALATNSARQLIERQARSAGIRAGGQLDPQRPGVLILGGWHVSSDDIETLEREAARLMRDRPGWANLLGIVIGALGLEVEGVAVDATGHVKTTERTRAIGTMRVVPVLNPTYSGEFTLSTEQNPAVPSSRMRP